MKHNLTSTFTLVTSNSSELQFYCDTAVCLGTIDEDNFLTFEAGEKYTVIAHVAVYAKALVIGSNSYVNVVELTSNGVTDAVSVNNAIPDAQTALEVATQWGNFSGVNTANGDFVTNVSGLNGQSITVLSASPLTTGESYVVNYNKPVVQPCSMEFAGSFVRGGGIGFATASLFANSEAGADSVPNPINIVSYYQSSAGQGAANTTTAGTIMHILLETPVPAIGANNAVFSGDWINITGLVDNRFNYSNACINFISADRKTIAVGFSDEVALPSIVSPASGATSVTLGSAKVNFYNNFSGARNAYGLRLTGTSATSAAVVSIFGGDDNQVSGTLLGDHRVTIASTNPTYVVGSVMGQYEIKATSRFKIDCHPDVAVLLDKAEQTQASWTPREFRTSVKPSSNSKLYPRFRLYKPESMSRPIAKIVSATKATATTTATIVTDAPHGLTTGNYVTIKGIANQTVFASFTTPAVVTVIDATSFTVVCGTATIATSYGGSVIIANGGKDQPGIQTNTIQNAVSYIANGSNWLLLTGLATWFGVINIGDYIDIHGVRNSSTGADLGVDGAWEVANIGTTLLYLKPIFDIAGNRVSPALTTLASTPCSGTSITRQTLRAHDLSVTSRKDNVVSIDGAGTARIDKALPIYGLGGTISASQSTAATVSATTGLGGWYVHPAIVGLPDIASAALTSTTTTSTIANNLGNGFQVNIAVTAVTGTTPTLDIRVEESFDGGTNWVTLYEMQRITANGSYNSPILRATGRHIRYVQTVAGTTPSFTRAITRNVLPFIPAEPQKRLMDRSIALTTLNSITPILFSGAANNVQLVINLGTATTPPALQLEGSEDGVNFYSIGSPLTGVASSTVQLTVTGLSATFVRAKVTTVGATVVAGYVSIKAWS